MIQTIPDPSGDSALVVDPGLHVVYVLDGGLSKIDERTNVLTSVGDDTHASALAVDWLTPLDERSGTVINTRSYDGQANLPWTPGSTGSISPGDVVSRQIVVVDTSTNTETGRIEVSDLPGPLVSDIRNHNLYVGGSDSGSLWVVNERSGATVRHLDLGCSPTGLAADAGTNTVRLTGLGTCGDPSAPRTWR